MNENMRFKKIDDIYVDNYTGEILSHNEVINMLQKEKKKVNDLLSSEIEIVKKDCGVVERKDTHLFNWNNKNNPTMFTKCYKQEGREIIKKLTVNEMAIIFIFIFYLETETNRVVVNGKNISNKFLSEQLNLSNRTIVNILNSLEKKNVIKRTGKRRGRKIFLNPFLAFDGKDIDKNTLSLFNICH